MKRFSIVLSALFVISMMFIACNEDQVTELAWTNGSAAAINEIVWADGDAQWNKSITGYDIDEQTESKEVNETTGTVECALDNGGGDFQPASVQIANEGGNTLNLDKGESYVYEI